MGRRTRSPTISTCGLLRATFARAIPTGCSRRRNRAAEPRLLPVPPRLETLDFDCLTGWSEDGHLAAFRTFERSARALTAGESGPRLARPASRALIANAEAALAAAVTDDGDARAFFETRFRPFRV